jgi:hypothetical protein
LARAGIPLQKVQFQFPSAQGSKKTNSPAVDCWIYLFRSEKVVTFAYEIYVDPQQQYHLVALDEHHGKDIRPYPKAGEPFATILVAKQARGKPPELLPYWMLFSPFQLTWSRLCEPGAWSSKGNQLTDTGKFFDWARKTRSLQYQAFTAQVDSDIYVSKLATTPWHEAYALSDQFEAEVRHYQDRLADPDRFLKRYMLGLLSGLRAAERKSREAGQRPESSIEEHLNLTRVWEVEQDIKDDQHFWNRCESTAHSLVQLLEKPPFLPVIEDLRASDAIKDTRASHAMMLVLGRLHESLNKTKIGNEYLARFAKQNEKLIVWQDQRYFQFSQEEDFTHPDAVNFKHARKTLKSYWYFVKAYVEHIDRGKPGRMVGVVKWWADKVYKVPLEVKEEVIDGIKQLRFDRYSLRALQVASTKTGSKVAFFAVLDAVYLVYTMASIVTTWRKDGGYEGMKKVFSALGALTSAVSSRLSMVELVTLMSRKRFDDVGKALLESPLPGSGLTPSQVTGKVQDLDILKHEALSAMPAAERDAVLRLGTRLESKLVKRGLGFAGGVFDLVTGGWNSFEEISTGDTNAAWAHGATAVGGLMVMAGSLMLVSPLAPVGAVLILLGSVVGLVGSVLAVLFDDSDLEDWVKFSYFGKMNRELGIIARNKKPGWAGHHSLAELAQDLKLQRDALESILFKVEATCSITEDCFILDVICRFVVTESRLWLGLTVIESDGKVTERHRFLPWHDFKHSAAPAVGPPNPAVSPDPRVRRVFDKPQDRNVRSVRVTVQLDIFGDGQLRHPPTPHSFDGTYLYPDAAG